MHWKAVIVTLAAALATIAGCSQRTFLNPDDLEKFHQRNYLPLDVDRNPNLGVDPLTEPIPTPSTIDAPERDPRYMTLAESIACSLEKGTTGRQFTSQLGTINEELLRYQPNNGVPLTGTNSDSLRVLSLLPAIEATVIDGNLARFDAKLVGSVNTGTTDQPIQGFNSFNNGDRGSFITSLAKPLPTGGMAAITLSTNYQNLSSPPKNFPLLNPAWTSRGQLTFEQPLWQGSGVEINQILNRIPFFGGLLGQIDPNGSQFVNSHFSNLGQGNFNTSVVTSTGILVARVRYDQSRADFEAAVNFQLVNVEVAYWNLYGAYVNLYSSETALKQAYEAWKISKTRYETGKIRITDYAQTRGQYEQFRGDRMQALGRILEAERILRVLIGLPPTDGKRIVPIDAPTLAPYRPDWDTALKEALTLRPELVAARQQ